MFAITGITGKVGGETARTLLEAGAPVRAVVRDAAKGDAWAERGCAVAVAEMNDPVALTEAFRGADGVFVLIPPVFDPAPGFPDVKSTIAALETALTTAQPAKVVVLSTIGAQAKERNLLTQLGMVEEALGKLGLPLAFLRAGWFMENSSYDVAPAREKGVIPSFLTPLDKPFPMVATVDIGRLAAELLQENWSGTRVVELEGPVRVTPNDIAATFGRLLGRDVRAEVVPREGWEAAFRSAGMKNPEPRMRMLDGFNEGWIDFEGESQKGTTGLETVLTGLVAADQG